MERILINTNSAEYLHVKVFKPFDFFPKLQPIKQFDQHPMDRLPMDTLATLKGFFVVMIVYLYMYIIDLKSEDNSSR